MPIIVNLDVMLAKRKVKSKDLAKEIGISEQNLSMLKSVSYTHLTLPTNREV